RAAVPALGQASKDEHGGVRVAAAEALAAIDPRAPDSLATLRKLLRDDSAEVRAQAATALGGVFGAEARPAAPDLLKALWDEAAQVRSCAAESLGRVGPGAENAAPALAALLTGEGEPDHVYSAAAEALGRLGPAARAAAPTLVA